MENLSHTFAGLAVGELVHRALPPAADADLMKRRRRVILTASAVAGNFPDLDLVYTNIIPPPLGYLLHHRGHTHTLLWLLPQALLLVAALMFLRPLVGRMLSEDRAARRGVTIVVILGFLLHFLFDSLNSYGVHLWHPFLSGWFYGDSLFIAEPFFWIAFGVPFAMTVARLPVRAALLLTLAALPILCTALGLLTVYSLLALLTVGVVLASLQRVRSRGVGGLVTGIAFATIFIVVQIYASRVAGRAVRAGETSRVLDIALTPLPTNPFCWNFLSLTRDEGDAYRIRHGRLSIWPEFVGVEKCPWLESPDFGKKIGGVVWTNEESGSVQDLQKLAAENCHVSAWLRFGRIPSVNAERATDLRFARMGDGNFSTLRLDEFKDQPCPDLVPDWGRPRADLLTE